MVGPPADASMSDLVTDARRGAGRPVRNPVQLCLMGAATLACVGTGFMSHAPNRLAEGASLPLRAAPAIAVAAVVVALGGLIALAFVPASKGRDRLSLALALALAWAVLAAAGGFAHALVEPGRPAQRQALGPAFWIVLGCAGLNAADALRRLRWGGTARASLLVAVVACLVALAASGLFRDLSLTRELVSHRRLFLGELARHVELVVATVLLASIACAPLVWLVRARAGTRGPVFAVLGLLQTIPSIALFGLLIAPLEFLATRFPALKAWGVSGLGVAPTLVALVLYAAFPLVRMGDAAFAAVPPAVGEAAAGLGFGARRRFWAVDLPLAAPVLLVGLRIVTLQTIGLATVAALIGGGGLGTFVFAGIGQYALDLVLVGAIPIVLLALAADGGFRLATAAVGTPGCGLE